MTADGILHWYMEKLEDPKADELIISAIASGMVKMEGTFRLQGVSETSMMI